MRWRDAGRKLPDNVVWGHREAKSTVEQVAAPLRVSTARRFLYFADPREAVHAGHAPVQSLPARVEINLEAANGRDAPKHCQNKK